MKKILLLAVMAAMAVSSVSAQSKMDYVVTQECLVASNKDAYKEMTRACVDKDESKIASMVAAGKVAVLKKGTNVRLTDSNIVTSTITVLDGSHKGRSFVIAPSNMKKK